MLYIKKYLVFIFVVFPNRFKYLMSCISIIFVISILKIRFDLSQKDIIGLKILLFSVFRIFKLENRLIVENFHFFFFSLLCSFKLEVVNGPVTFTINPGNPVPTGTG